MSNNDKSTSKVPLVLAIVGCGQIVTHHLEAIGSSLTRDKIVVGALCDPSEERRAVLEQLAHGYNLVQDDKLLHQYDSLDDLIGDSQVLRTVDIFFIAVPHDLHEKLAMQALSTNKIVVLEKPLAPTRRACDRLIQTSASRQDGMLIVAEQSPYWQEVMLARDLIKRGAIGNVVTAASYYYESMKDNVTSGSVDETGALGWRASLARAGGGIAMDGGLHWIRPLREMLGLRIQQVVGVIRRGLAPELQMEGESVAHALFQMEMTGKEPEGAGPLVATYSCNMLAVAPMAHDTCPYFRITGDKGELVIYGNGLDRQELGAGGLRLYNEENPMGVELFSQDRSGGFFLGFAGLWEDIYRIAVTKNVVAAHESVVRAADDVRVVLALYKSAETRQWVTV